MLETIYLVWKMFLDGILMARARARKHDEQQPWKPQVLIRRPLAALGRWTKPTPLTFLGNYTPKM